MTPSLNKSYKFQSDWPYNNSQVYLLESIIDDLKSDDKRDYKVLDKGYYFSSKVNYPNNKLLVRQNVYMDNNEKITKVEVVDKDDNVQIRMNFNKIDFNKKFDDDYFELNILLNNKNKTNTSDEEKKIDSNDNISNDDDKDENGDNKAEESALIKDIVYPMYLPDNTYLTKQENIETDNGNRLILTFGGDSSFVLVEEVARYSDDAMIIPVSGDFTFLSDVIGVINNNSIMWQSNGVEYYIASDSIEASELLDIAKSISVLPVSK